MNDKIKQAIERGEARARAAAEARAEYERRAAEEQRRATEKLHAEYRKVADQWIDAHLLNEIESSTARGQRYLDVRDITKNLRCTDDIMAQAIRDAGVKVEARHHEEWDSTYKAVW